MTIEDDDTQTKAVEVTLPDESNVTEIELDDKKATITEDEPKVEAKRDPEPESKREEISAPVVDEREKALADLRRQYEHQKKVATAEREARKKAEEYAHQQAQQVYSARNEVSENQLRAISNAIDVTEQTAATAERDYADAMASGDWNAAAKAQRVMAQAESQLLQLQNGKQRLEETLQPVEGRVNTPEMPRFEPQIQPDPVEMYAERLTPKSAAWLRSHPEAVDKIGRLTRAHQDALEDGIEAESSDYFAYIEQRLGISKPVYHEPEPVREETPRVAPKKSVASAPVSQNSSMSPRSNGQSNTMTLSSAEVEMALLSEPELSREKAIETYARNKAYLIKQGKLSA
jgi:hypothetical protein